MIQKYLLVPPLVISWAVGGCSPTVKVEAPDEPIVVNLNVKIEHKLKLKISKEVDEVIKEDSDIF